MTKVQKKYNTKSQTTCLKVYNGKKLSKMSRKTCLNFLMEFKGCKTKFQISIIIIQCQDTFDICISNKHSIGLQNVGPKQQLKDLVLN